jgi:hypothetical protein
MREEQGAERAQRHKQNAKRQAEEQLWEPERAIKSSE